MSYGIAEGEDVNGIIVQDLAQQTQKPYIRDVGVLAEANRLSIFIDREDVEICALGEEVLSRAALALPHTPVVGFGVNFAFEVADPDASIVDMLKPGDRPERLGQVAGSSVSSAIQLDDGRGELNLTRAMQEGTLAVSFNFHTDLPNFSAVADQIEGVITRRLADAREILSGMYALDLEGLQVRRALNN